MRAVLLAAAAAVALAQTSSTAFRTSGTLVVNLDAADFINATTRWDNRASSGAFSDMFNSDFLGYPLTGKRPYIVTNNSVPGVFFDGQRMLSMHNSSRYTSATIWGTSDWSVEVWFMMDGRDGGEVPLVQWGARGTTCRATCLGTGSHPTYGAGGFYGGGCDLAWGTSYSTETGPLGGQRPKAREWHHAVMTYTGIVPQLTSYGGVKAHTVALYLDGVLNKEQVFTLDVLRSTTVGMNYVSMGQFINSATSFVTGNGVSISQMRLHDKMMTAEDVVFNYALDAARYRPFTVAGAPTLRATPSPSASPASAATCPTTWSTTTHYLRLNSLQLATETSTFLRHGCYWMFATPNFPVTDAVSSGDATSVVRLGIDGTPGTLSLQSLNFPDRYMSVASSTNPYLFYDSYGSTLVNVDANRVRGTWNFDAQADGTVTMRTRFSPYVNQTVQKITGTTTQACGSFGNTNVRVTAGGTPFRFNLYDPLASLNSNVANVWRSERVILQSASDDGGSIGRSCLGRFVTSRTLGTQHPLAPMYLVPPVACRSVCAGASFSLMTDQTNYLFVDASGALIVGTATHASFTPEGASFVASRQTIDGVTGWIIYPGSGYAAGLVLTRQEFTCTADATCCVAGNAGVAATNPGEGGFSRSSLWRMHWEDGSGELSSLPVPTPVDGAPVCGSATGSPVATTSATGSRTPSSTLTPPVTPSVTASPSGTASITPSPSSTQVASLSETPSTSTTGSNTPSASTTPSSTATGTSTPSSTATSTSLPTTTPYFRTAGKLWVELVAEDYDAAAGVWDNRVSTGAVSITNGDFVAPHFNNTPSKGLVGSPLARTAVIFNVTADGYPDRLSTGHAYFPGANSFYGQSDWSFEAWVWSDGYHTNGENPLFQWGTRPGTTCNSGFMSFGSHPTWGAGGHFNCDSSWGSGTADTEAYAGQGQGPRRNLWHHMAVTYSGSGGTPAYQEKIYLDGQLMNTYSVRVLAIAKVVPLYIGVYANGGTAATEVSSRIAVARLRMHDGCLSDSDVRANYFAESDLFIITPTTTRTPSGTPTNTGSPSQTPSVTSSPSNTASGTQLYSFSSSVTPTNTPTASSTPTPTSATATAGTLFVDLWASDYDDSSPTTHQWDNRASLGALSFYNGDFVSVGSYTTLPTKAYVDGVVAVVYNATADGVADRSESDSAWFGSGMYGTSDWSLETWVWTSISQSENAVFQWGPRSATACTSAFLGVGNNIVYGAGGHFGGGCDLPYSQAPGTELISGAGWMPRLSAWHHVAMTYTGAAGSPANFLNLYVDGVLTTSVPSRVLNVARNPTGVIVGSFKTTASAYGPTGSVAVARVRVHDGCLTSTQVSYNFAAEAPAYIATPTASMSLTPTASVTPSTTPSPSSTQVGSLSETPSNSPSPSVTPSNSPTPSGSACPQAFPFTHVHRAVSFQRRDDSTAYMRHACYWIFAPTGFPVTNLVASGDATQIVRLPLDGAAGALSFESANYQGRFLAVEPDGYLYYQAYGELTPTAEGRARASWHLDTQPGGGFVLRSRSPAFLNQTVRYIIGTSAHTCSPNGNTNLRVNSTAGGVVWNLVDPLAPPATYAVPFTAESVVIEPVVSDGTFAQTCDGALVLAPTVWSNTSAQFLLAPPVGCPSVCNGRTLSLRQTSRAITVNADGSVAVAATSGGTALGASLLATRATVGGATGWVLSGYSSADAGNVLTVSSSCTGSSTCCASGGARSIVSAAVPATGLAAANLFKLSWTDGTGELTSVPTVPAVAGQPECPAASSTPLPTLTPTNSATPSQTATPSPTGSNLPTTSPTASAGASPSNSASSSGTSTGSPSATVTATGTAAPTVTPTATPPVRIAGSLLVELWADDFDGVTFPAKWDNRALGTPSNVSSANGDFVTTGNILNNPTYDFVGPMSVGAVVFNPLADGVADRMEAAAAAFPFSSLYGQSDYSVELWVYHDGYEVSGENVVYQWGARPGTSCNSGWMGVGSSPSLGAGGHWNCDLAFGSAGDAEGNSTSGFRPRRGQFNHVALTYTGAAGSPAFLETLYVNGAVSRSYSNRQLSIPRAANMRLGQLVGSGDPSGAFALARMRVHDGCLSAADVAFNYVAEGPSFLPTPTPTPSVTATPTGTASPSNTASGTAAATGTPTASQITTPSITRSASNTRSNTASPSSTATSTASSTPSPLFVSAGLLIDLNAADYDPVANTWDNRASAGAVSAANGDFVGVAAVNATPSLQVVAGALAVVFNVSTDGVADRLTSAVSYFAADTIFGSSAWSLEAWVYHDGYHVNGENALIQWSTRPGTACSAANMGVGPNAVYGGGGHWGSSCDTAWGVTRNTEAVAGQANVPRRNAWHHVAWVYSGAAGAGGLPAYTQRLYVDADLSTEYTGRALSIARGAPLYLGAFMNANGNVDVAGRIAVAKLRMHDGALSAADVSTNFQREALAYVPTPSLSPSPSVTASATASVSSSVTMSRSITNTPTLSATPVSTRTGTASPSSSATVTRTASVTASGSAASTPTPTATGTGTSTPTTSSSGTAASTPDSTGTSTPTTSSSGTAASTPDSTGTPTPTGTGTGSSSGTGTSSGSASLSGTPSPSASLTAAETASVTHSESGTAASTESQTGSQTVAPTASATAAATRTATGSKTAPPTKSRTATKTRTRTATKTKTKTKTKTRTRTPSKKRKLME